MLFPFDHHHQTNDFNGTVSHFPRPHQGVLINGEHVTPNTPNVIAFCPYLLIHDIRSIISGYAVVSQVGS